MNEKVLEVASQVSEKPEPTGKGEQIGEELAAPVEDIAEIGPQQQAQIDNYKNNATKLVWSSGDEESEVDPNSPTSHLLQMLQATGDPIKDVATATLAAHRMLEHSVSKEKQNLTEVTLLMGSAHLLGELVTLAEEAGLYSLDNDQRLEAYHEAVFMYFEEGLNNGTIDPVEFQKSIEPLMTEEQYQAGMQAMQETGISKTPPPTDQPLMKKGAMYG